MDHQITDFELSQTCQLEQGRVELQNIDLHVTLGHD